MRHAGSRASKWLLLAVLLGSVGLTNCGARERPSEPAEDDSSVAERPLEPLPLVVDFNRVRAELGERLFRDPRLSGDAKVACADCHHEGHGLADDKPHSVVANRPATAVNSPTMYNVRFLYKLSWGGKYDSLEGHLDALIENPKVMASSWRRASSQLGADPGYRARFSAAFPDGVTPHNV